MAREETRICQSCGQSFEITPEDFAFYEKIQVPPPTWCWRCRAMRRMSFRNMHRLYERTCDATGEKIFTLMPPDAPMPVYERKYWGSDEWEALEYGRDYDFSRPFFEQMKELFHAVPWAPMWDYDKVNSQYSISAYIKNCYLCFDTGHVEDAAYAVTLHDGKQCMDIINCELCELCYYCINTNRSYKTFFSRNCTSCNDVWFSQDCVGCTNCIGCTGLRNKNNCIFNKQYSKEEYGSLIGKMSLDTFSGIEDVRRRSMAVWQKHPVKYQHSVQAKDCTGDYIYNAAEIRNCFFAGNAQNCAHCQSIIYKPIRDSIDITSVGENVELDYEVMCAGGNLHRVAFGLECNTVTDSRYVINCRQGNNLFGCVGMRSKHHCILNKQYTEKEYNELVPRIIEHMNEQPYTDSKGRIYRYGEFFPPEMSPWGYNESQGQEYFPLTEREAEQAGYRWRKKETKDHAITMHAKDLPDSISDADDSILKEVIQCAHEEENNHSKVCATDCVTAFRITPQELQFYRQLNLPLPRLCFNCRHYVRVAWRNPPALYKRRCMCDHRIYKNETEHAHHLEGSCPNEFETSYAPDRPEIVYCEQCYQAEMA